jgi:hypothetical protein
MIPNIVNNNHERNVESSIPNIKEDIMMLLVCWFVVVVVPSSDQNSYVIPPRMNHQNDDIKNE